MPSLPERRRLTLRRETLNVLIGVAIFGALYIGYLAYQNHRAEAYYANLRKTDPLRYLDDLRKSEGFAAYLDKYRLLEGYTSDRPQVPPFILGRWTMRVVPQRVAPGTVFSDCLNPVSFQHGLFRLHEGPKAVAYKVEYRITGQDLILTGDRIGRLAVAMVSYGSAIDHLELHPPGEADQTYYAYRCGS
ncbi:hypothetical protein U879_10125 [Defluviimonas sp. 20V17]|uniref:Uncharacterized protein n=1 Tax=Allgaiera indica TaxID=765699 RepID=A0AAN4ZYG2_9RHOB|nr:hypothetical protein [Allgaiera indica]KDB03808.1 hypothetical protein U879_10125 [Defluviimonas sp. 20V17]GHE00042.1 hypothetical protein GCM10008024_10170 [Allgaiera indica]SDW38242.1 hypothetical protein SAMN05444006_10375 [Allgaiera indica]